ncbi:MAG: hypothetical protein GTO41_16245 [Burkholderiales bacterium]|nr:hypothetical protein [Burkholderiales bacterium]
MTYIGIDNGVSGAIAIIRDGVVRIHKAPTICRAKGKGKKLLDEPAMWHLLQWIGDEEEKAFAVIELAKAYPPRVRKRAQGSTSAISIGRGDGLWRGMLVAAGIPYQVVSPRKWQAALFVGVDRKDTKAASVIVAKRLFPSVSLRANDRCRKDDHNMADALLLAEYARRCYGEQTNK